MTSQLFDYRQLPEKRFTEIYQTLETYVEATYDLDIITEQLPVDITGDFDGKVIKITNNLGPQLALFTLIHIVGHCIQWNIDPELRALGLTDFRTEPATEADLLRVHSYEDQASSYGITLLHEVGITYLDQWVSDGAAADWKYLQDLYRRGKEVMQQDPFSGAYHIYGTPLLKPLPIPQFIPKVYESRFVF